MELLKRIDELLIGWGMSPATADWLDQFIAFMLVLLLAFVADFICRKVLLRAIARLVQKTKATWDDILFDRRAISATWWRPSSSTCSFRSSLPIPTR